MQGKGSDLTAKKTQQGKAKRKLVSHRMALSMIDLCKPNEPQLKKSLWNTFHCQSRVYTAEGRLYGQYCKNRFCTLCCANRKADIINRYLPIAEKWPDPYFVTLTVKAVRKNSLRNVIHCILKELKRIIATYRKKGQRKTGNKLIGIRSLECNFNPEKKTYNPHFHIVVAEKWMAEILINEWLRRSKPGHTSRKAQDARKVGSTKSILIETVKYGSKIFTEPQITNKISNNNSAAKVYAAALKNIFIAMKGVRLFDRFGFNLPENKKNERISRIAFKATEWTYIPAKLNWIDKTGISLFDHSAPREILDFLTNNTNLIIE